jgi:Asp-tRNA(Asn)/Glu-tRNA(Gln) amidotransferase A subunit family amidase
MTQRPPLALFPQPHQTVWGALAGLVDDPLQVSMKAIQDWSQIHAWVETGVTFNATGATGLSGSLAGIPIGVKDIIDVEGQPTSLGCREIASEPATRDSPVVARLRQAGAIVIGKTVTTQFACFDPPPTLNPWNTNRTPGGSSSGSAAAVATGMCVGAIGSQTGGSIIRPATYCGVCGCKPTFGMLSMDGVFPVSPSLDHIGPIARCATDLAILLNVMSGRSDLVPVDAHLVEHPRIGRLRGLFDDLADADARTAIESAIASFESSGADVIDVALPDGFDNVLKWHRTIMCYEAFGVHCGRFAAEPDIYFPGMTLLIEEGSRIGEDDYQAAKQHQARLTQQITDCFADVDVLLTPATTGAAPNRSSTGDPAMNSPFSFTGVPTVSLPVMLNSDGLPLGIQIIGPHNDETKLFQVAGWCESAVQK